MNFQFFKKIIKKLIALHDITPYHSHRKLNDVTIYIKTYFRNLKIFFSIFFFKIHLFSHHHLSIHDTTWMMSHDVIILEIKKFNFFFLSSHQLWHAYSCHDVNDITWYHNCKKSIVFKMGFDKDDDKDNKISFSLQGHYVLRLH